MFNMEAERESFRHEVIYDISFVRSSQNFADGLTISMSKFALCDDLYSVTLLVAPEQWIL